MTTNGPRLHLVLAESALERVPEALCSHPSVAKAAKARRKAPGEILLDDTYHHNAMRQAERKGRFVDAARRGRPDIVHTTLLVAQESLLNKAGRMRVWVHTYDDHLVRFRPDTRLQRAQHRFAGLMEAVFRDGAAPAPDGGDPLVHVRAGISLEEAVRMTGAKRVVVMEADGIDAPLESALVEGLGLDDTVALIVGGFPSGELKADLSTFSPTRVALGAEMLTAWTVVGEAVTRFRLATVDAPGPQQVR